MTRSLYSRLAQFVIGVADLGVALWSAALHATPEPIDPNSQGIYRVIG